MAAKLTATLLPYQHEAMNWCLKQESTGGILAYDMGLGKTVISCAVIASHPVKTLVMVPTSLLSQWTNEVKKHTTGLTVAVYHGSKRHATLDSVFAADIILSTAAVIAKDLDVVQFPVERWIIDEAHRLKNNKGKTYMSLLEIAKEIPNKLFLTGTPVCNRVKDLISLITLTNLAPYNDVDYWHYMREQNRVKTVKDMLDKVLLRRTKEDTIPHLLPQLTTKTIPLKMANELQCDTYRHFLEKDELMILKLLRLRQSANNHKLLAELIASKNEEIKLTYQESDAAVKVKALEKILQEIPAGDKVLVFSQFTSLLSNIKNTLQHTSLFYHGGLTPLEKNTMIQQFKTDPVVKILFINLRAGGCGLNLVEANHVVLLEPYWNESEQKQAIDRVYRIGQTKDVSVYRMYIKNSVEIWIQQLQKLKHYLATTMYDVNNRDEMVEQLALHQAEALQTFEQLYQLDPSKCID